MNRVDLFDLVFIIGLVVGGVYGVVEWHAHWDHCPEGYSPSLVWPLPPLLFAGCTLLAAALTIIFTNAETKK
jgi:hypothetical protein